MFVRQRCPNSAYESKFLKVEDRLYFAISHFHHVHFQSTSKLKPTTYSCWDHQPPIVSQDWASELARCARKHLTEFEFRKTACPLSGASILNVMTHNDVWINCSYSTNIYANFKDNISMENHFSLRGHHLARPLSLISQYRTTSFGAK